MTATAVVGDGSQIGTGLRRRERLVDPRGAEAAGRMEIRVDDLAVVFEDLPRGPVHRVPRLRRLRRDAEIDLIAGIGIGVEAERLPAAAVLQREAPRHDRLGQRGRQLVGPPAADLRPDDAGDVALHANPIDDGDASTAGWRCGDRDAAPVVAAVREHGAVSGETRRSAPGQYRPPPPTHARDGPRESRTTTRRPPAGIAPTATPVAS